MIRALCDTVPQEVRSGSAPIKGPGLQDYRVRRGGSSAPEDAARRARCRPRCRYQELERPGCRPRRGKRRNGRRPRRLRPRRRRSARRRRQVSQREAGRARSARCFVVVRARRSRPRGVSDNDTSAKNDGANTNLRHCTRIIAPCSLPLHLSPAFLSPVVARRAFLLPQSALGLRRRRGRRER